MDLVSELEAALAWALDLAPESGSALALDLAPAMGAVLARDPVWALAPGSAMASGLAARRRRSAERGGTTLQS